MSSHPLHIRNLARRTLIIWHVSLQAEADEKAGKAIDRMMFRAFRDESHWDTNPLTRRNRLTASNPLL